MGNSLGSLRYIQLLRKPILKRIGFCVCLILAGSIVPPVGAASIVVNTLTDELNSDGDCSLREAVVAANTDTAVDACPAGSGHDTITVPVGTYTLSLVGPGEDDAATGDLDIKEGLNLTGSGAGVTIIDGASIDRVLDIAPQVVVINEIMKDPDVVSDTLGEWFEIYNPNPYEVDINGWTVKDDGIDSHFISASSLIVPGMGYVLLGRVDDPLTNGGVDLDYAYGNDIILANGADEVVLQNGYGLEVDRVNYDDGVSFPDPFGASMELGDPSLDNNLGANWCTAITPYGDGDFGTPGLVNSCSLSPSSDSAAVTVNLSGVTLQNGANAQGAGLRNAGELTFTNGAVVNNGGPGIAQQGGSLTLSGVVISGNTSAGLDSFKPVPPLMPLSIYNSTIENNASTGISGINTALIIVGTTISGNGWSGITTNGSSLTLVDSTVSGNSVPFDGGGLYLVNVPDFVIKESVIHGNTAARDGGGIYYFGLGSGGKLSLVNVTVSGNHANDDGGGIMVASGVGSTLDLTATTITDNTADSDDDGAGDGGGVHSVSGAEVRLKGTLIAQNLDATTGAGDQLGQDCVGSYSSYMYNLIGILEPAVCTLSGGGSDVIGTYAAPLAPLMGPLQDNGGPTVTHALLAGSPAIEAGQPGPCTNLAGNPLTVDQRAVTRPQASRCDIGAFEYAFPYGIFLPLVMR